MIPAVLEAVKVLTIATHARRLADIAEPPLNPNLIVIVSRETTEEKQLWKHRYSRGCENHKDTVRTDGAMTRRENGDSQKRAILRIRNEK